MMLDFRSSANDRNLRYDLPQCVGRGHSVTDGEWLVIDTLSNSPTVIAAGSRARKWRPLANVFRGTSLTMVHNLVEVVVNNLKDSQSLVDLTPGTKLAYARPILGPGRQVHAVMVWLGTKDGSPPPPPRAIGWTWDLTEPEVPLPVPSPGVAEFYGFPAGTDLTLTQLLSTVMELTEIVDLLESLQGIEEGAVGTGEWLMRRRDGGLMKVRYAFRCVRVAEGLHLHGISQQIVDYISNPGDSISARVLQSVVDIGGGHPALVNTHSGRIQAWLTEPPDHMPAAAVLGLESAPQPRHSIALSGLPTSTTLAVFEK